ncbi:MAG TPA: pyridoxal phosphate-dependent aminotransferase [Candidatus Brocadiia bacterium]|nr:pyridoxal phosphate-dependent aminotransferase [Candidatus Brocadiia bacterium]
MRTRVAIEGVHKLEYEIRHIVPIGRRIQSMGVPMTWENIGDPIAMGEKVEPWIREAVQSLVNDDVSWAYSPTQGMEATREFICHQRSLDGGVKISPSDILFVNGIADAVDKIYDLVRKDARIIMPTPCYPTHSSNESKRGNYDCLFFRLDPRKGWEPDLDELRCKVKYNPQVVGIAFVNPDNPTGYTYPPAVISEIVEIARQYGLFIICDEIYTHICYNGAKPTHLSSYIGDVPAIAIRGISKEYPWPGARCGWMEFYNAGRDPDFNLYVKAIIDSKMMEVCSTTLPQMSIPKVMGDARYGPHLQRRAAMFERRSREACDAFRAVEGVVINPTTGAFYFPVVFEDGLLNNRQTLPIPNPALRAMIEDLVKDVRNDKRFVYYLMASAGVCVTPLSGFHSDLTGFRMTLLETDDAKRRDTLRRLAQAIPAYIASA